MMQATQMTMGKSAFKNLDSLELVSLPGVHKEEITSLHLVKYGEANDMNQWRIVSTSQDGFI